jgi:hypothetical protein
LGVVVYSPLALQSNLPKNTANFPPLAQNPNVGLLFTDPVGQQILTIGQVVWFSRYSGMINKVQR